MSIEVCLNEGLTNLGERTRVLAGSLYIETAFGTGRRLLVDALQK